MQACAGSMQLNQVSKNSPNNVYVCTDVCTLTKYAAQKTRDDGDPGGRKWDIVATIFFLNSHLFVWPWLAYSG